jgi:hypothetical protein
MITINHDNISLLFTKKQSLTQFMKNLFFYHDLNLQKNI